MLRNSFATACKHHEAASRGFPANKLAPPWTSTLLVPARFCQSTSLRRFAHQLPKAKANARAGPPTKTTKAVPSPSTQPTPRPPKSTLASNAPANTPKPQQAYPERLLIYHAGGGRTIFLAAFKLTAVFIFIFSAFMIAPAYYISPFEPTWMAPIVVVGGAIPLIVMVLTTAPFVTYVHLQLPAWARNNSTRLHRYAASLPANAMLDVTSMKWVSPRVTRLRAQELYLHKGAGLGAVTLRREVPEAVQEQKKWYAWKPVQKFYVGGKSSTSVPEPGIWEGVIGSIARGWKKANERQKLFARKQKP